MNKTTRLFGRVVMLAVAAGCLLFSSCVYEVPITAQPTRKIDRRLLGNWTARDAKNGETVKMKVVKLDDYNYIVFFDNKDLYRVFHSDVARTPFVSVQILDSDKPKYAYSAWTLNEDGTLVGHAVNDKVVPDETKTSSAVQKLLEQNLKNPSLFEEPMKFTKDK
jgi:hypothetical protein